MSTKRLILWVLFLIAIDQWIKIVIVNLFLDTQFSIIPNIFYFYPIQNIYGGWFQSMAGHVMPIYINIPIRLFALLFVLVMHRYVAFYTYNWNKHRGLFDIVLMFALAGFVCSFIDLIFWGGTWDYILLFDWFVFDLKDMYLNIGFSVPFVLYIIAYCIFYYYRLPKEERKIETKKTAFIPWIRAGLPMKPK